MPRRWTAVLATALLVGAGLAFGAFGVRAIGLERAEARRRARTEAERVLQQVRGLLPSEMAGACVAAPEDAFALDRRPAAAASLDAAPPDARLLYDEAAWAESAGHPDRALDILRRLAAREPADPLAQLARAHAGALAAASGDEALARDLLAPQTALTEATDEHGLALSDLAWRHLAPFDLRAGRTGAALEEIGRRSERYRPDGGLDWGDLVIAVAREAAAVPGGDASAKEALAGAAGRAERAHRILAGLARGPVAVDGPWVATIAPDGERVLLRGREGVVRALAGRFRAPIALVDAAPPQDEAASAQAPVEGGPLWLAVRLERPGGAGTAAAALLAGLGLYGLGAGFLARAVARSARAARMQGDFVAAVSHEMKTPIAAVQAMAEMLADGRVTDPERVRSYAERMRAEMGRLGATVRDVLDVARIERDAGVLLRRRPVDPAQVVRDVAEMQRPLLERRGFRFEVAAAPAARPLFADPDALAHVISNLVDNAAKFSEERREVEVRGEAAGRGYRVVVSDRGPGVPSSDRERIFDRFYRGEEARRRAVPGVGLGLHVARQLVAAHGGRIHVEDREGGGSRFVVEVPEDAS